ncbi:hypothetical protein HC024_02100 [Methylococcaceae bacterium WWC4]|nr:hypothetical protein [Methylococcaceae bacterium WWC4]
MKRKLIGFIQLAIISLSAIANETVTLSSFNVWSSAGGNGANENVIRVTTDQGRTNPANCLDADSYMALTTLTKETQSRIYASLLTSKVINKPINVIVSGTSCESDRPAIISTFF